MDYELLKNLYDVEVFEGYSDSEIAELSEGWEEIPSSLLDVWTICGKTSKIFDCSNDPWINLNFIRKYNWTKKSKEYFYLLNENQGVFQVAIRKEDMSKSNPPVYVVETDKDGNVNEVGMAEESLTAFLMGMLIYEASISVFEYAAEDIIWYEDEELDQLEEVLTKYSYHVYNWYSDRIDLYTVSGDELLFVMVSDSSNGTYAAKTEEAYERIDELVGSIGER